MEKGGSNLPGVNASRGVIWGKWRNEKEDEDPHRQGVNEVCSMLKKGV